MIPATNTFPHIDRAITALVAICPEHTTGGKADMNLDKPCTYLSGIARG